MMGAVNTYRKRRLVPEVKLLEGQIFLPLVHIFYTPSLQTLSA